MLCLHDCGVFVPSHGWLSGGVGSQSHSEFSWKHTLETSMEMQIWFNMYVHWLICTHTLPNQLRFYQVTVQWFQMTHNPCYVEGVQQGGSMSRQYVCRQRVGSSEHPGLGHKLECLQLAGTHNGVLVWCSRGSGLLTQLLEVLVLLVFPVSEDST